MTFSLVTAAVVWAILDSTSALDPSSNTIAPIYLKLQMFTVVFLSCPLVKKHADLSGSFLYSQSTMKDMYSKPTNRTELSIPMKTKSIA